MEFLSRALFLLIGLGPVIGGMGCGNLVVGSILVALGLILCIVMAWALYDLFKRGDDSS